MPRFLDLKFYAFGTFILLMTAGPLCIAIIARSMTNGVHVTYSLASRVSWGDILSPLTAILGLSWIAGESREYLFCLKWLSALILFITDIDLLRRADTPLSENKALSAAGVLRLFWQA